MKKRKMTMLGNEKECICHKPMGIHMKHCNAFRLSEFWKKCGAVKFIEADRKG